jgi:hypothetical protein
MTTTLYQLVDEMLELDRILDEAGGETTDELDAWRETHAKNMAQKIDNIVQYEKVLKADIMILDQEEKHLYARRRSMENKVQHLKNLLRWAMESMGTTRLRGTYGSATLQNAGGAQALILDVEEDQLPSKFQRVVYEPALGSIRDALAAGDAEAAAVAHLEERKRIVVIR